MMRRSWPALGAALLGGCGLSVQAPDLFLLTRTGAGRRATVVVSDGGTVRCNGGPARRLPGPLLLNARDLASALDSDAKRSLRIASPAGSVYRYSIRLADGRIAFPDTAGRRRTELARAELFATQAFQQVCGVSGST